MLKALSRFRILPLLAVGLSLVLVLLPARLRALPQGQPVTVRVLMPSPFVDATAPLVAGFNREHRDLQISVDRGPLDTEAMSDLAIGSLLLGSTPYDLLLMDVSWTARYAAAGWLVPLETWFGDDAQEFAIEGGVHDAPVCSVTKEHALRAETGERPVGQQHRVRLEPRALTESHGEPEKFVRDASDVGFFLPIEDVVERLGTRGRRHGAVPSMGVRARWHGLRQ